MSPPRLPIVLFALVAMALSVRAQVIDRTGDDRTRAAGNAAEEPGAVEPDLLPGNPTPPDDYFAPPELPLPLADGPQVSTPTEDQPEEVAATPRRFRYAITVDVRGVYDDNVNLSSGADRKSDFYAAVIPQLTLGIGDVLERQENFISVNYSPSGYYYFENSDFSTLEHIGRLEGQWRIRRVVLTLSQDWQSVQSSNLNVANPGGGFSNQTNLDIGGRRRVTTYATHFSAAAPLTGKTTLRAGADYTISDPEGLIGSDTLTGTLGADYQYGPKLSLGAGFSAGKQSVEDPNPDTTFQQANLRATYQLTGKIAATGSAGVEFRQSEDANQTQISPVFAVALAYAPFDGTQLDISANRRTQNSASAFGQDFTSTQLVVSARQRFLQRIYFNLSVGIQNQTYFSTATGMNSDRNDNYYFLAPGIDVRITEFWFAGVFYTYRENDSSLAFNTFDDNQYGIRTTLRF